MITRIFDVRDISEDYAQLNEKLAEAAEILAAGGTVAFPTETVYGLGANALDETAVAKIYEAKGRPSDNPLIVHIASEDQLDGIVREVPEKARAVMAACWPGPVSIIMKKDPRVPDRVTAGLDTVAIRMPENPEARVLLSRCGCPVAAPSANLSGKPSPTRPEHVLHDLEGRVDGIVLGRNCDVGIESTVLDLSTEPPVILRPGIVTAEDLNALIGEVRVASNSAKNESVPKAPGMKYTHYAPEAPLILYRGTGDTLWQMIRDRAESELAAGRRVGLMLSSEHLNAALETFGNSPDCRIHDLGSIREPKQAAQLIFDILRSLDREGVDLILGETFEEAGVGFSVMNRLTKAATEVIEIEE